MNPNYDVVKRQTIHNDSLEKYEKMKMDLQIELGNLNSCNNGPLQRNFHRTRLEGPQRPAVSFVWAHYEEEISQKKAQPSSFPSASPSQTESRSLEATVMATAEKKRPRISSGAGRRPSRKEVHLVSLPQLLLSLVGLQSLSSFSLPIRLSVPIPR